MSNTSPAPEPRSMAWRRLDVPGHDAATLSATSGGWRLEGAAAFLDSGRPCHLSYRVDVDDRWRTRSADVQGWRGADRIDLRIRHTSDDHAWLLNGQPVPAVGHCIDVDLAFTPATNLLPIRRLALPIGGRASVVAAWLPFPDLVLRPLDQVYHRSAEAVYDYSSSSGTFRASLSTSPDGFVVDYPGLWRQERD